jgi:hypothetical protein
VKRDPTADSTARSPRKGSALPGGIAARGFSLPLAGVLLAAFGLRLAAVLWLSDTVPHSDFAYYHLAAQKIVESWGFFFDRSQVEGYGKFGWWPPGYPFFVAVLYRLFGVNHRVIAFAQVLLGTFVCWVVYRIGSRAGRTRLGDGGGERVGLVAALLVAIDPTYVFLTNLLASENLYVVWLVLGLWVVGRTWRRTRLPAVAGVLFGLGALTRAIGIAVPLVAAAWLRGRVPDRRAWLRGGAWLLGACALTIAPWTLRNAIVVGSPALVCFGGGLNFYFGHNEVAAGYRDLSQTPMAQLMTQAEIDRMGYRLGLQYLTSNPMSLVTGSARKVADLFGPPGYAPHANSAILLPEGWQTNPEIGRIAAEKRARQRFKNGYLDGIFTTLATCHSYVILAGALAACLLLWKRLPDELRLSAYLCGYWIVSHVVFWAQPRFRYPMEILLALLAAYALVHIAGRVRSPARKPASPQRSRR